MRRVALIFMIVLSAIVANRLAAAEVVLRAPGVSKALLDDLNAASLSRASVADETATTQDHLAAARADYGRLIGVLYAHGFYGPVITITADGRDVATMSPFGAPGNVSQLTIDVAPGPVFRFGQADIAPLAPGTAPAAGFTSGAVAESTLIRRAAEQAVTGWRDAGHAKAALSGQNLTADHRRAVIDARVAIAPGPKLRFGALQPDPNSAVRAARQRAIAGLPEGQVFAPAALDKAAERLRRTGVFRSVVLREGAAAPDNTLPIAVEATDSKPRRYGLGAEFASQEGVALSAFWLHRNLLGGAERLTVDGMISGIGGQSGGEDYSLKLSLARPATFTPDTQLLLEAEVSAIDDPAASNRFAAIGAGLTHRFDDRLEGRAGVQLRYSDPRGALMQDELLQLYVPVGLTYDARDVPLSAGQGVYLDAEAMPFAGFSGSNAGLRFVADARAYHTLGPVVLAGRAQLGAILGAAQTDVPPDLLFLSGGGGTVRGQPFQSLGVDLPGGTVGGRSFAGLSGEIRLKTGDKLGIVGFADAGFISAESGFGGGRWHSGAGLGVRYDTGIGPIRFDVALPTSGGTGGGPQIYIGIGQAF